MTEPLKLNELTAISPADGRYAAQLERLRPLCSEYGLLRYRALVELRWVMHLAGVLPELADLGHDSLDELEQIAAEFDIEAAQRIKAIEATTNHDVKAVEYYLREQMTARGIPASVCEYVHFACTSEDINNLAHALMLQKARAKVVVPALLRIEGDIAAAAHRYAAIPMLARTHGQAATPTTLGKELANFSARLAAQRKTLERVQPLGKFNGAVGNYNAHLVAAPEVDWPDVARRFVESLGLTHNTYTTQIEPHDWIAEYCHALKRCNTVLLDVCRDVWGYISLGYFRQRAAEHETGSSTMPHKVNPIDFENAEGNLGIANALLGHFADKLPVSRLQRDLSDSTVLRNVGVAIAHCSLACTAIRRGIAKLEADEERIGDDLAERWELLAEPIQTVMRRHGLGGGYEELKALTRGKKIGRPEIRAFILGLELPAEAKKRLLELEPASYVGNAASAARNFKTD